MLAWLFSAVLAVQSSAAVAPVALVLPPRPVHAAANPRAKKKRKPVLKLRRSRDKRLRDARTRGAAVAVPAAPVPKLRLASRALPEFAKGTTTAKAALLQKAKPASPKASAKAKGAAKTQAEKAAKSIEPPRPKLSALSTRAAPGGVGKVPREPAAAPIVPRAAPKPKVSAAKTETRGTKTASDGSASGGGAKGGGGKVRGAKKSSKAKGGGGAAKAAEKAESKSKPAGKSFRAIPTPGLVAAVPAPPALALVAKDGKKRLPEPLETEPEKEYEHDGARWLPAREGRKLPSLKAGGMWWLYDAKPKAVVLKPAFPGMFRGRADDPTIVLYAAKDGTLLVQTWGDRSQAALWKDAAAPVKVASLGDIVAAADFDGTRVRLRRRDGTTASFGADGKPES